MAVHSPCPYKQCGSSDAFNWNESGYGFCHSCHTSYPTKDMPETFNWVSEEYPLKEKRNFMNIEIASGTYEGIRSIDPDVCQLYGIQLQKDKDGNPVRYAFKYKDNVKYRLYSEKKFWYKEKGHINDLFGPDFNAGTSKKLYITEGEFDAASLYQVLGKSYPVLSIPSSSISDKFFKKNQNYLNSFEEIIYAGELDDAGRDCADKFYEVFPEKLLYVPMSKHKDANEFLQAGDTNDLMWAARKPQRYTPENFFTGDDAVDKAIRTENPYEYVPTGHSGIDEYCRGLVKGGLTFIKAPRGTGKCLGPDQGVLMYDGTIKKAKDIKVNDKLLGPDSKPRTVLSLASGREEMFMIVPVKGKPWTCNRSHILSLFNYEKGYVNISVDDYLKLSENKRKRYVQYRTGEVSFAPSVHQYDPYFIGMYLGDGSKHNACITLGDTKKELLNYLTKYVASLGWSLTVEPMSGCNGYHIITNTKGRTSPITTLKLKLFKDGERVIPLEYKTSSPASRKRLLAGLLDTDGHYSSGGFEIVQKSKQLADDICFVSRSLGKAAYRKLKVVNGEAYYRVFISGDFTDLPFKRHKVLPRTQVKSVLRTGFEVMSLGEGDYYGFEIDGDKLFVLDDFTVTHNTEVIRYFETAMLRDENTVVAGLHMEEMKSTTYRAMATYELGVNVRTKDDAKENGISEDEVVQAAQRATKGDRTVLFEMRSSDDPLQLLYYVRLAATVYKASYIFIDHVQRLAYLSNTGVDGATSTLTTLGSRMAQLAKELNIGVIFISQVNDDGRTKYAAALEEEAIICIKLVRDTESEDEVEQNTTTFIIDKNRPFARLGNAGSLYYDRETTILREHF